MNTNTLLNATIAKLRSDSLEAYAAIEVLLASPESHAHPETLVQSIAHQAKVLAESEGALLTFQQYFVPKPKPGPVGPPSPPIVVDGDRSPTMRRAMEAEDIKNRAKKAKERLEAQAVEGEE